MWQVKRREFISMLIRWILLLLLLFLSLFFSLSQTYTHILSLFLTRFFFSLVFLLIEYWIKSKRSRSRWHGHVTYFYDNSCGFFLFPTQQRTKPFFDFSNFPFYLSLTEYLPGTNPIKYILHEKTTESVLSC